MCTILTKAVFCFRVAQWLACCGVSIAFFGADGIAYFVLVYRHRIF